MKISCASCGASFQVPDASAGRAFRCGRCKTEIQTRLAEPAPPKARRAAPRPVPAAKGKPWLVPAGIAAGALVLVGAAVLVFKGDSGKKKEERAAATSKQDEAFAKLRRVADDSPELMHEFAEACWLKNDRAQAEEYYVKAAKKGHSGAKAKLASLFEGYKLPATNGNVEEMAKLLVWLTDLELTAEADGLAKTILKRDPGNVVAHTHFGDVFHMGRWYDKAESELIVASSQKSQEREAYSKMTLRDQRAHLLKEEMKAAFNEEGPKELAFFDCAPELPYLLCIEKSPSYSAELVVEIFKEPLQKLVDLFFGRYGANFDAARFKRDEVCLIYIFETQARYVKLMGQPSWAAGHYDTKNGRIFLYKDVGELYETVLHEGVHQLVAQIAQMDVVKLSDRRNMNMFWFSEGLATYFEYFKRDEKGGFILGEKSPHWAPYMKKQVREGKHRKLTDFLKLTYIDFSDMRSDRNKVDQMYGQSWSIVYFLQTAGGGKYRAKFDEYFRLEVKESMVDYSRLTQSVNKSLQDKGLERAKRVFGDLDALNAEYEEFCRSF